MFFFGMSTGFANQVEILISRMKFALSSQSISSPTAKRLGSERRRVICLIGLVSLNTSSECPTNSLGILGMSAGCQAKISQYSRRSSTSALSYAGERLIDTIAVFDASVGCTWCFLVSFVESKAASGAAFFVSGSTEWSVVFEISSSSSCIPNDCEILWKSASHLSDFWKSPSTMIGP